MKIHRQLCLYLCAAAASLAGAAHAQSPAQAYYADCLSVARYERDACRRVKHGYENCGRYYRIDKDRCLRNFKRMHAQTPHHGGYQQGFERIPVPRRSPYLLPGMR